MRFVLQGDKQAQLRRMLGSGRACLALFAAADALKAGFLRHPSRGREQADMIREGVLHGVIEGGR
jgi:hypothetical protein